MFINMIFQLYFTEFAFLEYIILDVVTCLIPLSGSFGRICIYFRYFYVYLYGVNLNRVKYGQ